MFAYRFSTLLIVVGTLVPQAASVADESVPASVQLSDADSKHASLSETGLVELSGSNRLILKLDSGLKPGPYWIEFEAFCLGSISELKLSSRKDKTGSNAVSLPPVAHSEAFVTYRASIGSGFRGASNLNLDLTLGSGTTAQLRSFRLTNQESPSGQSKLEEKSTTAASDVLIEYLNHTFPAHISSVQLTAENVIVSGKATSSSKDVRLVPVPMFRLLDAEVAVQDVLPIQLQADGRFKKTVPRFASDGSDLGLCRWQLVQQGQGTFEPISHARYAQQVHCVRPDLPAAILKSKKGLGGWHRSRSPKTNNDLVDLQISAVTININAMHDLASLDARPGWQSFEWQGRTYYANPKRLEAIDKTLLEAQRHGVMVSVILLVTNPKGKGTDRARLLANPEADVSGIFAMPNVTSEEGLRFYGAILNLMAERWTRPDGLYGRIHHWIMHNEVDFGWVWTNAGRKSDVEYMSLYHRSMRITDLIVRQHDPNARVWISLTHHWANKGNQDGYGSKRMLELLVKFCKAEGDFPWAVAYHPYPQNLRNPRTWEDHQATYSFDTPKITPKNLEVLDAWMKRPEMRFMGEVRPVHLSENGFNSPDYTEESLNDQAAGMAFAWKKMKPLSSIKMWHYHNWIDNRHEGGLRIGLRKFPDDEQEPYSAKPIWYTYQALGGPNEDASLEVYLKTIAASAWNDILYRAPIE